MYVGLFFIVRDILDRWADKELGGGTVFALDITRDDILVYIEDKIKQEVILIPEVAERAGRAD